MLSLRLIALLLGAFAAAAQPPRLIVLTDIGGDPDDQQSMVRLMTCSNEFSIEGLIASASGTPGELKEHVVRPELIRRTVEAYGEVRPNLLRHAPGYPPAESLLAVVKSGNPRRGIENIGEQHDTEGSRWIVSVVDRNDPRPVNIAIWGGATELAQALWRVRKDRSPAEVSRFVSRLRVHSIGHQDNTGPWIVQNFPELFFILSSVDEGDILGQQRSKTDRRLSVYRGMYLGGDESLTSRAWVDGNVRLDHGPLGALYPDKTWTAPNPHGVLKEGDTPSWFYFLPNGLGDAEHPEWGGWGGRFRHVRGRYYNDAQDGRATVWRWRPAFQNDFAARMDWCVKTKANHHPVAVLNGKKGAKWVQIDAKRGTKVRLSAAGSRDPDGDRLEYRWLQYPEGTGSWNGETVSIDAPAEAGTMHVILEIRDSGSPQLTAYRRAVIRVK